MSNSTIPITSLADLVAALSEKGPRTLELQTSVACPFSITLPPDCALTGKNKENCILGFCNGDGIGLYTQTGFTDMGNITLKDLSVTGQVSISQPKAKHSNCMPQAQPQI